MVAQSSHDAHVILEGQCMSEAGEACSDWGFGHGLECNQDRSKGSSRVWLGPIHVASGVLNKVSEVNLTEGMRTWVHGT